MWMMGYSDGGDLYMSDSFNASRKLRPLIPRPVTAATSNAGAAISAPRLHGADHHMFSLNHNMASMADQNKREFNAQQVVVSSRWNPTPEQLRALEELYRRGTRTPSAEQIQHITAQLRRYGKIEGKNVFYWFQNHKARERQKRRRQMESDDQSNRDVEIPERKETGASRSVFGVDQQTKNWPPSSNSSTLPEESAACTQKAAKAAGRAECKSSDHHQWMKMDERVGAVGIGRELELPSRRNDTWQAMQLSCPSLSPPTHLINALKPPMDPKFINKKPSNNPHLTTFLLSPPPPPALSYNRSHDEDDEEEEEIEEDQDHQHHNHHIINLHLMNGARREVDDDSSQTLQLFPLRSGDFGYENANGKETEMSLAAINNGFATPHQFFEFLPLKN